MTKLFKLVLAGLGGIGLLNLGTQSKSNSFAHAGSATANGTKLNLNEGSDKLELDIHSEPMFLEARVDWQQSGR